MNQKKLTISPGIHQMAANPELFEKTPDPKAARQILENLITGRDCEHRFEAAHKGVKLQPGSGSGPYKKGDATYKDWSLQIKCLDAKKGILRFQKTWIPIAESDMKKSGMSKYAIVVVSKDYIKRGFVITPYKESFTISGIRKTIKKFDSLDIDFLSDNKVYSIEDMPKFIVMNIDSFFNFTNEEGK